MIRQRRNLKFGGLNVREFHEKASILIDVLPNSKGRPTTVYIYGNPRGSHTLGMAIWREKIFALMRRNVRNATNFFGLPPARVVEMGSQIEFLVTVRIWPPGGGQYHFE